MINLCYSFLSTWKTPLPCLLQADVSDCRKALRQGGKETGRERRNAVLEAKTAATMNDDDVITRRK